MKAIITAGGKGTRLFPISRAFPKELIPFCGIPVIEYGINLLKDNEIDNIIVVTGTKKGALQDYLGNGDIFGVNIAYIIQEQSKGLGHAVQITKSYIDNDDFVLLLGDTIFIGNTDLQEMIKIHKDHSALATLLVEYVKRPERYGVVKFDNTYSNRIISLYEKPKDARIKEEFKINDGWYAIAGLYVLNKKIFEYIRRTDKDLDNEIQLTDTIKLSLEHNNIILGHVINGKRIDVGTWDYLTEEKKFYADMTDEQLEKIKNSRNDKITSYIENN